MNQFTKELLNDQDIPDPFEDFKKENLYVPDDYKPSEQERKEAIILFKELMKYSLDQKIKGYVGLPEHIIYNYFRGVDLFRGINSVKDHNLNIYRQYSYYYRMGWDSLATDYPAKEYHQKLSRILGYKYEPILKNIRQAFFNKF